MPYTPVAPIADGDVLGAAFLNSLSANQEFLHAIGNGANAPFGSYRGTVSTLDTDVAQWFMIPHKQRYLHYRLLGYTGSWEYARVYYNGIKVAGTEATTDSFIGYADLDDITTWPNYAGAWATSTAYEDDVEGDGVGGNSDDGSLVSHGGSFWRCKLAHTSGSDDDEPGVGANTATYWDEIAPPTVGNVYQVYADVNFSGSTEVGVEYLIETDGTSL